MKNTLWAGDAAEAAKYYSTAFPEELRATLLRADELCENTFLFSEHWEMEATCVPVHFAGEIGWEKQPGDDPEWIYALNRHTAFYILGRAWRCTGETRYAETFARLMDDWLRRVPHTPESENTAWRALEAGIRCENWLRALCLFGNAPAADENLRCRIYASLEEHGRFLMQAHHAFQRISNWGMIQDHGLFLLGVWFENAVWIETALARMTENLNNAVMGDGTQWEQSPMYHGEVLHAAADTLLIARQNGIAVPPKFEEKTHAMFAALAAWVTPTGWTPRQSDSDDIDARDLLALGAILFRDGALCFAARGRVRPENIWDIGPEAEKMLADIPAAEPLCASAALPDSGNFMLRENHSPDSTYIRFHSGTIGGGHGHADLLHIDIMRKGEYILADGGRGTYVDGALRRELKLQGGHNTLRIDGADYCGCTDSWGYTARAVPIKGEYRFGKTADFASGGHMGYWKCGVLVWRKLIYVKPDILLLFDWIAGEGAHTVERSFHFGAGKLTKNGQAAHWEGKCTEAHLHVFGDAALRCETARCAPVYNTVLPCEVLRAENAIRGNASLLTVISLDGDCRAEVLPVYSVYGGSPLPEAAAQAVTVEKNGRRATVIVCHEDNPGGASLLCAGGCEGYGKAQVFTPEVPEGETLAW